MQLYHYPSMFPSNTFINPSYYRQSYTHILLTKFFTLSSLGISRCAIFHPVKRARLLTLANCINWWTNHSSPVNMCSSIFSVTNSIIAITPPECSATTLLQMTRLTSADQDPPSWSTGVKSAFASWCLERCFYSPVCMGI